MVNILDIDPEGFVANNAKECTDATMVYYICYSDKIGVPRIDFNNIEFFFSKKVVVLVFNCFLLMVKTKL